MKSRRGYAQTLRAQKAAENEDRILTEAERLFATELFDRVSLAAVAEAAGVSIPTLQRRFTNKEGLFNAVGDRVRARISEQRRPLDRDVDGALSALFEHYELEGKLVWHMLRQEHDVELLHDAMNEGRATHRKWIEQVFADKLRGLSGGARERRVDTLVAATDLFIWKLLRIDMGRSRAHVEQVMRAMVRAVVAGED